MMMMMMMIRDQRHRPNVD